MKNLKLWSSILTAGLFLTACGDATTYSYKVSVKNLTYAQPMSPMLVSYHARGEKIFSVGESASLALEHLAEGGDNRLLLSELKSKSTVADSKGGNGLILPSKSDSVTLRGMPSSCISVASMLVNTNDAFIGADCIDVSALPRGGKLLIKVPTYDAGTEMNSETALSIPGPAGGGEGFNAIREAQNFVRIHAGVVTSDEGLMTSALSQADKWDNPTASIMIERIK